MAGLTQTIPSYSSGISEQPDQLKAPGQVVNTVNSIPDLVNGLYKRPGAKRLGTAKLTNVQSGGSWFHYYRDETEGAYIGQVAADGTTRVWSCNDGVEKTVHHGAIPWVDSTAYEVDDKVQNGANIYICDTAGTSAGSGGPTGTGSNITDGGARWDFVETVSAATTSIKNYLSASNTEDVQALTINDTTFLNNRDTDVTTTGTTDARPEAYFAYVELLRTENGRQYALNVYSDETTTTLDRATRIKISSDTLDEGDGTGTCPGIGTQVFSESKGSANGTNSANAKNLVFRITALGQQGVKENQTGTVEGDDYQCSYNREITLLHGGEGWDTNDTVTVSLDQAKTTYNYTVKVKDHEETSVKGYINGGFNGVIRPAPTPFDADTAVTVDTILGSILTEMSGTGVTCKVIGNGIYMSSSSAFNVESVDQDLMRVMGTTINDVQKLPIQCRHGAIVKIANARMSEEDDYYLKFEGENNLDGPGTWVECAKPGIVKSFNATTMPHILQRQSDGDFLVKKYTWADRSVGDDTTNPLPSFKDKTINKVIFFRNRLAFLSGENIITAQPGNLTSPSFWVDSALTVSAVDSIDIACSSTYPSDLYDAIEVPAGLLCFSTNEQFLFSSDAEVMNPDTAKLRSVSVYNYHKTVPPIGLGSTVGFIDNSNKYSRFMEMAGTAREQEATVVNTSEVVPTLLPKELDLIANSRENGIVLLGKTNSDEVIGYRYLNQGENRIQSAWFKWKHNNPIKWHFIVNDEYYLLDTDNFLQRINLVQADTDPSIDENDVNYLIHLDNWTTVSNGTYNATTKLTTFANQSDWIDQVTSPNGDLVLLDIDEDATRVGRYVKCTVTNTDDFTVPGNWAWTEELPFSGAPDINTEQITLTTHGLETGDPVRYLKGDTVVGGLTDGTTYYVIKVDSTNIKLATNATNANAGTAINLTTEGTGSHKLQKLITLNIGYLYEYSVKFPRFYVQRTEGKSTQSDTNSKLTIHRAKINFGKIGLYETTLKRVGKLDYTEIYESAISNQYNVADAPYLDEEIQDVPIYERNENVELTLKSSHPAPATLRSLSWEGDYSPMHYRRV